MVQHDRTPLSSRCRGRWRDILITLGAVNPKLLDGRHHACPWCGGKDRWRWTDLNGSGSFYCNQCGTGGGAELVMRSLGVDFREAARRIESVIGVAEIRIAKPRRHDEDHRAAMNAIWRAARPIEHDDEADAYLVNRLGRRLPWSRELRTAAQCTYWENGIARSFPAMLARLTASDGTPCQIHRTYLRNGCKAPVDNPRRLMPGPIPKGSAVRLAPVSDGVLGVAEGIETALAASLIHGVPVWAALTAGNLVDFVPPDGTNEIVIYGDADASFTGQAVAYALARRLTAAGLRVDVMLPSTGDWLDALLSAEKRAAA